MCYVSDWGPILYLSLQLTDLVAEAQYECLVQAKNRYGWSEASRIHRFSTNFRQGKSSLGDRIKYICNCQLCLHSGQLMMWSDYTCTRWAITRDY